MKKQQKRDKNGRFAGGSGSSGFAASRLAAFGKHVATKVGKAAAVAGGTYLAGRALGAIDRKMTAAKAEIDAEEAAARPVAKAPEASKSKSAAPHNRSISLGHGVRIKGAQVSTLEQAASVAINNTRNHGFVAHSSDKLRTAKSLEKLALIERRAHPEGTPESAARKPHYVITRQGVDALVKSGLLTTGDRDKWERARGRESFGNNL
jgi:hypothetical protein